MNYYLGEGLQKYLKKLEKINYQKSQQYSYHQGVNQDTIFQMGKPVDREIDYSKEQIVKQVLNQNQSQKQIQLQQIDDGSLTMKSSMKKKDNINKKSVNFQEVKRRKKSYEQEKNMRENCGADVTQSCQIF